jgi:hypothetical protein
MIFPGHVAASWLCHRYLKANLPVALLAGVFPDVVDKTLRYVLHLTSYSRVPAHTLWAWMISSLVVLGLGWLRTRTWSWGYAWALSYAVHLLCDAPFLGGSLPLLYPFVTYSGSGQGFPFWIWNSPPDQWPWRMLIAELLVVIVFVISALHYRRDVRSERLRYTKDALS